jgi:hypothetical protein
MDYNKNAPITKEFFAKVQNKLHYAIHGHTAAEVIYERADADKKHMGLTTWENSPQGKIVKTDVSVAKNYLTETELESLGRIVNAYLDLAEDRAKKHIPMTMEDAPSRKARQNAWTVFLKPMTGRFFRTQARQAPKSQKNSPKANLRNTVSFKTVCLNPILTGKSRKSKRGRSRQVNNRRHGRGFSQSNLNYMRLFYLLFPICETMSHKSYL